MPGGTSASWRRTGREFLVRLAARAPLLPGAGTLAFVDIDSPQKRVLGHKKQGARFGHTKIGGKKLLVRGLNALAATVSTLIAAPVIAATRLRGGNALSARGAASFAARAVATAREAACAGMIVARLDSGFCTAGVIAAIPENAARHGRGHLTLHLRQGWHRQTEWLSLREAACGPPATAA